MENKNLNWIINKIQTEMFEEKILESHYKAFEKFKNMFGGYKVELSKYATIEILEINEEEGYYLINSNLNKYIKKVKVYKDRFEVEDI